MKEKELKREEIEASHILGGAGEGRVQGRGKWRGCTCYSATEQDYSRMVAQKEARGLVGRGRN